MMPFRSPYALAIIISAVSVVSLPARPVEKADAVVVSYSMPSSVVLHQPIVIQFTVNNATSNSVRFDLGRGATKNFVVRIARPDGVVVNAKSLLAFKDGPMDPGRRAVPALGTYTQELILNEWFPFDQSGSYGVDIGLAAKIQSQTGETVDAPARGVMTVQVGPRNDGVLSAVCHDLFWQIRNTTDVASRYAAAKKLAYINDEVALPYVKQIVDDTDAVDHFLIPGLVRLGTAQARSILAEMAQSNDYGRASQASAALSDLRKE